MSPPPWFVIAATTEVKTLLERLILSAAGPRFIRTSLVISTVVPEGQGVCLLLGVNSSPESRDLLGEESVSVQDPR